MGKADILMLAALMIALIGFIILYTMVPTKQFPDNVYITVASFFIISIGLATVFNLLSRRF